MQYSTVPLETQKGRLCAPICAQCSRYSRSNKTQKRAQQHTYAPTPEQHPSRRHTLATHLPHTCHTLATHLPHEAPVQRTQPSLLGSLLWCVCACEVDMFYLCISLYLSVSLCREDTSTDEDSLLKPIDTPVTECGWGRVRPYQ